MITRCSMSMLIDQAAPKAKNLRTIKAGFAELRAYLENHGLELTKVKRLRYPFPDWEKDWAMRHERIVSCHVRARA